MTLAKTIRFSDFVLTIGDGATPTEVFTAPCAFNARSFVRNKNLQEIVVPDCADEDKPGWIYRDPLSVSWGITGEGVADEGSINTWDAWFLQAASKNVKLTMTVTSGGPRVYSGAAHLQTITYAANRSERMTFNVDIIGDGILNETPTPTGLMGESFMDGAEEAEEIIREERARRAAKLAPAPRPKKSAKEDV